MVCGIWHNEKQEGTHVRLLLPSVFISPIGAHLQSSRGSSVVVCGWHPLGQLFASGDRNKKVTLWTS